MSLKVWHYSTLCIRGKLENQLEKVAKIKEESKILSVVVNWLEYDKSFVNTPEFCDQTLALARQHEPSKQRLRTGVITRDASIDNCVQNLNLSSGDGIPTISSDDF